jgi:hypothetical protein
MNKTEVSIIIQNELDKCNEKTKQYDIKYNNNKNIKLLYDYLNNKKNECSETEQKIIMDDIQILSKYI